MNFEIVFDVISKNLSIFISIVALLISILTWNDQKSRTKIMNEQLGILKAEQKNKLEVSDVINSITFLTTQVRQAKNLVDLTMIKTTDKFARENILQTLFQRSSDQLKISLKNPMIRLAGSSDMVPSTTFISTNTYEDFYDAILKMTDVNTAILTFSCTPDIIDNEFIDLKEYFKIIHSIIHANHQLSELKEYITPFDQDVLEELDRIINNISRCIFSALLTEHEIEISNQVESDKVFIDVISKIIPIQDIDILLSSLSNDIINRLTTITKSTYLKTK